MDPLEALLRPVVNYLNRNIGEMTPARELCSKLDGRVIAIRVQDTALAMFFTIENDLVNLSMDSESEPDVVITGSLLTLAGLIGAGGEQAIRDGKIDLTGDARLAQQFYELLCFARPDVEEELSSLVGDATAYRLGVFARGIGRWASAARTTIQSNIREYLQEESRELPSRYEVERFTQRLDTLRDDVERLDARIRRLEGGE